MTEVETLREAAEIADDHDELRIRDWLTKFADRLDRPDPDEALAEAMWAAGDYGHPYDALVPARRAQIVDMARAARAHIAAERGEAVPAPEPWTPTPGRWAQIKPGVDRGDVPRSVERVLVLEHAGNNLNVGWEVKEGDFQAWGALPPASLAPVQPRVWDRAEDVPRHVVVRDAEGVPFPGRPPVWAGDYSPAAPFTEVMPEGGAL